MYEGGWPETRPPDAGSISRPPSATVRPVDSDPDTEELRIIQAKREQAERSLAEEAPEEDETAQHERRADKARYLQRKLEERAESEREAEARDDRPG